jgi:hypothetical protein
MNMSDNKVWLVTLNDGQHTEPLAWGIFDNPFFMTGALAEAGLTGNAEEVPLKNADGTMASLLIRDEGIVALITRCNQDDATAIAENNTVMWSVPDSLDGLPWATNTESE